MKILMVCLGNICRSPMADGLMRKIVAERNLEVEVDSCGTGGWHVGEPPDSRMQRTALDRGVDISFLRARQFRSADLDAYDLVYAMDSSNLRNILNHAEEHHRNKVRLILNELHPGEDMEVPDPYYGGDAGFTHVYELLEGACNRIADKIENGEYR